MRIWRDSVDFILLLLCLFDRNFLMECAYETTYLTDVCPCELESEKIHCYTHQLKPVPRGAGHIALATTLEFYRHFNCQVTIRAPKGHRVQIMINEVVIPQTKRCTSAGLQIYDGNIGINPIIIGEPICGRAPHDRVYRSSGDAITLYYYQNPAVLWNEKQLNLTFTYIRPAIHSHGHTCNETFEFECDNRQICIPSQLKCDTYDNCSDGSDERWDGIQCGVQPKSNPSVGLSVGVSIAVGALCCMIILLWIRLKRRKTHRYRSEMNVRVRLQQPDDTPLRFQAGQDTGHSSVNIPLPNYQNPALSNCDSDLELTCNYNSPDFFMPRTGTPPPPYDTLFPSR